MLSRSPNPRGRTPGPRAAQMQEIAQDVRLHSRAMHTRAALIAEVMARYSVTYGNARTMICRARKSNT